MTPEGFMRLTLAAAVKAMPTMRPRDWCCEFLTFDEATNHGGFKLAGCEYIGDALDDFANPNITDEVIVWGSQSKKTGTLMGGVCWRMENDPVGCLWVMPSIGLARKFSKQRFKKMIAASEGVRHLIPTGALRHNFSSLEMMLGASTINFVGSNSPGNLSSNPCRLVIQDEVDKFDSGGRGDEGDPVGLADQRTKDQVNPQRWKTSTPTLSGALIWQEYLKGNQMRYFVPCPHCRQEVVFAWSPAFTVLPKTGKEAYIIWDKEAKAGQWDLERVRKSARAVCPHCKQDIRSDHKTLMIRDGVWRATNPNAPAHFVSRHLSSLYACSPECSFGSLAVKFLQAAHSLLGLQGFINGDLAEPYEGQEKIGRRTEIILRSDQIDSKKKWVRLLTVDCQQKSPHFWYVARDWGKDACEGVEAGSCDVWEDVRQKQLALKVQDQCVFVDSGYGARSDAEVYQNCMRYCQFPDTDDAGKRYAVGWTPIKSMPTNRRWKDPESGLMVPWFFSPQDPFAGTAQADQVRMDLLEFAAEYYMDLLASLRERKGRILWTVPEHMATEEYWRHMDGQHKDSRPNPRTGLVTHQWVKRARYWPDHILDCERNQLPAANMLGLFTLEETK